MGCLLEKRRLELLELLGWMSWMKWDDPGEEEL